MADDATGFSQNQRGEIVTHDVAHQLTTGGEKPGQGYPAVFVKHSRYGENGDPRRPEGSSGETWGEGEVSSSLDAIGHTARTATAVVSDAFTDDAATLLSSQSGGTRTTDLNQTFVPAHDGDDDPLLPAGLSSARYRCIGNGVAAPVAEWIAWRLADYFAEEPE